MKLAKFAYSASTLIEFFQDGLEHLGAVCERTWHDRLQVVAEGRAARLWNASGELMDTEVSFIAPDQTGPRDAAKEAFPGCPLTFRLAEALSPAPLCLQRVILRTVESANPPPQDVADRLWRLQNPGTTRWFLATPFQPDWHFSLLALARCEIQAMDQHWSLHRLAMELPSGARDEDLAKNLDLQSAEGFTSRPIQWPPADPAAWQPLLRAAVLDEVESELAAIRQRQESYLRRELDRVDAYFQAYEEELRNRLRRQQSEPTKLKLEERLAAARTEHERRRQDQVQRHEIRVIPHVDALLLLGERVWRAAVTHTRHNQTSTTPARFLPRTRQWVVAQQELT